MNLRIKQEKTKAEILNEPKESCPVHDVKQDNTGYVTDGESLENTSS